MKRAERGRSSSALFNELLCQCQCGI